MATHIVKQGDTLSDIAKQYGTTYQEIARTNGISDPNKISVGQVLQIGGTDIPTANTTVTTYTAPEYEKSDVVKQAEGAVEEHKATKPGDYQSNWQDYIDDTVNKIMNREDFSYDLNGDALYQQYKDQYMLQGNLASMDVMGQAAAMNGGYGNSYVQTVGHQTYQNYLQQLNDKVPELYQIALDQYNQETQDLYNMYGLYTDREEQDYGRYRDGVSDYYTELDYLTGEARYQSETDYNQYMDKVNMDYTMHSDEQSKAYETAMSMLSLGVMPSAEMLAAAGISEADAQAIVSKVKENEKKTVSSGGGGGGGNQKYSNDNPVVDDGDDAPQYTYEETPAVTSFVARIRTRHEFARGTNSDNQKYKTYEDYVRGMLEKYESELTDNDIATICQMFGL